MSHLLPEWHKPPSAMFETPASPSLSTHQVHTYRCAAPIGRSSGCGRDKETRRRGCRHCSRSPLWQFWTGEAGEERPAAHPTERPAEKQYVTESHKQEIGSFTHLLSYTIFISEHISIPYMLIFPALLHLFINKHWKNSIHPSIHSFSPVCILLSRSEPLRSPALLPHADVSPSNHESHFPLSLFPNGERQGGEEGDRWRQEGQRLLLLLLTAVSILKTWTEIHEENIRPHTHFHQTSVCLF